MHVKPTLICEFCATQFQAPPSAVRRYCSQRCHHDDRARIALERVPERFVARVVRSDGCWEWNGPCLMNGYGVLRVKQDLLYAHHIAYRLASGGIPDGFQVLHTCDNPPCTRNDDEGFYEINGILRPRWGHLWAGTVADNMADMARKGRAARYAKPERTARGERNAKAKLTEAMVHEIRSRLDGRRGTQAHLAREYGVGRSAMFSIAQGKTWRHIL